MSFDKQSDLGWLDVVAHRQHISFEDYPYIVVAVEQIPRWYSASERHGRVLNIRTIGILRELPNGAYVLESLDNEQSPTRVWLWRSMNLTTPAPKCTCSQNINQGFPNYHSNPLSATKANHNQNGQGIACTCYARVKYHIGTRVVAKNSYQQVLGRISWVRDRPFIEVHHFIPVDDLKSVLKLFALLYRLSRPYMHQYYIPPDEEDGAICEQRRNVRGVNAKTATPQ